MLFDVELTAFKQQHLTYALLTEFLHVIYLMPLEKLLRSLDLLSSFLGRIHNRIPIILHRV